MDDEGEPFVAAGTPPPEGFAARGSLATWVAVAVLGAAVFVVGIWEPAWSGVTDGGYLEVAVAAVGGALAYVGIACAAQAYRRAQPKPVERMPGVEFFTPPTLGHGAVAERQADEESR
jgi:hypothetical protein